MSKMDLFIVENVNIKFNPNTMTTDYYKCVNCKIQDKTVYAWIDSWGYVCKKCYPIVKEKIKNLLKQTP
jgi:hypothetical protein